MPILPAHQPATSATLTEIAHDHPDAMTILFAIDTGNGVPAMAKTWFVNEAGTACRAYDNGYLFQVRTFRVASTSELVRVLGDLKPLSRASVIRGALAPDADWRRTVRRSRDTEEKKATFTEVPRRWVLLDFDKFTLADFPDPVTNPVGCVEAIRERLPPGLRNVAFFWSFSSSTGMKPEKLGVHLWLLLEKALVWREVESFIFACGADVTMSRTVQAHFTATPIFQAPLTDPLPRRFGTLPGIERVPAVVIDELVVTGMIGQAEEKAKKEMARRSVAVPRVPVVRVVKERTSRVTHVTAAATPKNEKVPAPIIAIDSESDEVPPGMIGDGHRHEHLLKLAGFSRSRGLDADGLRIVLLAENAHHFYPSLAEREVEAMAASYGRYDAGTMRATAWESAVVMAAGLIRHDACAEAVVCAAGLLIGDEAYARRIVEELIAIPRWQVACAESQPGLVLTEEIPS